MTNTTSKIILTGAMLAMTLAVAPAADATTCAAVEPRADAARIRRLNVCARRAALADARGRRYDLERCAAKVRARFLAVLGKAGCPVEPSVVHAEEAFRGRRGERVRGLVDIAGRVAEIDYEVIDGVAVFEGDIVLGPAEEVAAESADTIVARAATDGTAPLQPKSGTRKGGSSFVWPNNVVPFEIDSSLSDTLKDRIYPQRRGGLRPLHDRRRMFVERRPEDRAPGHQTRRHLHTRQRHPRDRARGRPLPRGDPHRPRLVH